MSAAVSERIFTRMASFRHEWSLLRRLWPFLLPHRHLLVLALLLIPMTAATQIVQPLIIMRAVDAVAGKSSDPLYPYVLEYAALLAAYLCLQRWHLLVLQWIGIRVVRDIRMAIFRHFQKQSLSYFARNPTGRLVTRITNDVENINEASSSGLISIVSDIFLLGGIAVAMFLLHWKLALAAFCVLPVLVIASDFFRRRLQKIFQDIRTLAAHVNVYLQENISGMSVVQVFTREKRNLEEFTRRNEEYRQASLQSVFYDSWFSAAVQAATTLALASVLWYGGICTLRQTVTFGLLVAFIDYIHKFFDPIEDLTAKYTILQSGLASCEKIFLLLDDSEALPRSQSPISEHRFLGKIEFESVSFYYPPDGPQVLRNINLQIVPGEKIALVGQTGSGKSTLVKLVNRLYDVSRGAVRIDDINVKNFDPDFLRRHIGVVLQDVFLFRGSIARNIALSEDLSAERIHWAAEMSGADAFIKKLPSGYNTLLGERGGNLSTGQRQLLAFARILAFNPAVVILDEATSSIDSESEQIIQNSLPRIFSDRTALIIAHRLSTIRSADRIVVLHHGEIKEIGRHDALLAAKGIYWRLHQMQFREDNDTVHLPT